MSKDAVHQAEAGRPGFDVSLMGVYLPGDYPYSESDNEQDLNNACFCQSYNSLTLCLPLWKNRTNVSNMLAKTADAMGERRERGHLNLANVLGLCRRGERGSVLEGD